MAIEIGSVVRIVPAPHQPSPPKNKTFLVREIRGAAVRLAGMPTGTSININRLEEVVKDNG